MMPSVEVVVDENDFPTGVAKYRIEFRKKRFDVLLLVERGNYEGQLRRAGWHNLDRACHAHVSIRRHERYGAS